MDLVISPNEVLQPPVLTKNNPELTVAIASLSIGGAERIVVDWASRIYPQWKVHLIALRNREKEWPVPSYIRVTRLGDPNRIKELGLRGDASECRIQQLRLIGQELASSGNPVCICHLLKKEERDAIVEDGACVVPVLHNAKEGWPEDVSSLAYSSYIITVSEACARDLRGSGWNGYTSVIRHIPPRQNFTPGSREKFRKAWNIPENAVVIGMIGAVKPQKNYLFALSLLKALRARKDAYLVIIGGPASVKGRTPWEDLISEIHRLKLRKRVALPGFIPKAVSCLPAFDVMLNTSNFEGLSIATLEALVNGVPVVASRVGGQGEIGCDGLLLVPRGASEDDWVSAVERGLRLKFETPSWARFPAYRLWTLAGLARPVALSEKVLFVTANLNSGGAQRSLVNLAPALKGKLEFEIAVAGNSTASYFYQKLEKADIKVSRAGDLWDAFSYAEALVQKICAEDFGTVCFWNVNPRVKLLVVKALGFTKARFIDVSPGDSSFDEMESTAEFQKFICFASGDYYRRLNKFVLKYRGSYPFECEGKVIVIPNGVPRPVVTKSDYAIKGRPRIAVNGRITPTKFVLEVIEAMRTVWNKIPEAELHIFGAAEPYQSEYAQKVFESAKDEAGKRVFFHGPNFEVISLLPEFDAYVVLGKDQGCPNALLEALAVGLPAVANDDGGTKEQVINGYTGLLVRSTSPQEVAEALLKILMDRNLAQKLGENGRSRVLGSFSMEKMTQQYLTLFKKNEGKGIHYGKSFN